MRLKYVMKQKKAEAKRARTGTRCFFVVTPNQPIIEPLFASARPYSVREATYKRVFAVMKAVRSIKADMIEGRCGILAASAACTKAELELLVILALGSVPIHGCRGRLEEFDATSRAIASAAKM